MTMAGEPTPFQCTCARCGHEWWTRTPKRPRRCAGCKCLHWERPARVPKVHGPAGPVGKPRVYHIDMLEVGESTILEFHWLPNGQPDTRKNASMQSAITSYGRRSGKTFERLVIGVRGIRVTRLS